jgi:hypothetical protein
LTFLIELKEVLANANNALAGVFLHTHAKEIIALVEAAEKHGCGWKIDDPRSTKPCEICEALAALNKEQ